jgi:phage tail-like protein
MPDKTTGTRTYAAAHFALELNGLDKIGMFRSVEGGGIKADVMTYQNGGIYDRWRQLGKPKFEDVKLQVGMSMTESFYNWVDDFFAGQASRKDGTIIAADFYYQERARRHFSNAMIKEMTFPKLDANDKNTAFMNITLGVEDMSFVAPQAGNRLKQNLGSQAQKSWKACNFRFSLDLAALKECCKRVSKVESFTVKQNILEYHMGGVRSPTLTPSPIDFPQISFTLPEADADPLFKHFTKRGVKGEVPGRFNGTIECFDNTEEKVVKFTLTFNNADIINIQPDKSDASTEEIKQVKVDLYVESMLFKYAPDPET